MANKFGAKKVTTPDGQKFDSIKERDRYVVLKLLERAGNITGLERQVKFELIPTQREESTEVYKAGPQKGLPKPGAIIEKPCTYVADFTYYQDGKYIVEDAKGCKTEAYKIKKKLMLWVHGIRIKES
jgi:hypothetical protein